MYKKKDKWQKVN